jgi:hypothetical protein
VGDKTRNFLEGSNGAELLADRTRKLRGGGMEGIFNEFWKRLCVGGSSLEG